METPAPDLVRHFNASTTTDPDKVRRDEEATTDKAVLEQLAERISAARSVY